MNPLSFFRKSPPPEPVVLVRTRAPLTPEETRLAFRAWRETDASRQMIEDAFDTFLADAVAGVTREDITPDQRAYAAGALDAARRFRAYVFSLGDEEQKPRR